MICWSDYPTCLEALFNRLSKKEIGLFMIINHMEKGSYGLFMYGDDDIDWAEIAKGDWRILLCMTSDEIWQLLMTPLMPYFPSLTDADAAPSLSTGE